MDERELGWLRRLDDARPGHRLSLGYLDRWVAEPVAHPLTPSLPLPTRGGPGAELSGDAVFAFFDNLLPEGDARAAIFASLGLPASDTWQALAHMGRDLAGAVRVTGGPARAGAMATPMQRRLAREELSERLRHRDEQPFALWDGRVNQALAGCQDKLAIYVEQGEWSLVDGPQIASTHLLKPTPAAPALSELPFNEFFCMRLAERVGLDVARVELHALPEPVLLVERFDRQRLDDGRVRRLHVIDACQALGMPAGLKYERSIEGVAGMADRRDGVSMQHLFGLLQHSPAPLLDSRSLLRWSIFQLLIGNADAHGKNLSFFVDHGGLRLAPAYDLVCLPPLGYLHGHAMAIGDAFVASEVTALEWASFAERCGLAPRSLCQELARLCELVRTEAERLATTLAAQVPRSVSDAILGVVVDRCERQSSLAPQIPKIDADLL